MSHEHPDRKALERRRRDRLMELIRQQDAHSGAMVGDDPLAPGFARAFQDAAAKSLGRRPADKLLSLRLRGRD